MGVKNQPKNDGTIVAAINHKTTVRLTSPAPACDPRAPADAAHDPTSTSRTGYLENRKLRNSFIGFRKTSYLRNCSRLKEWLLGNGELASLAYGSLKELHKFVELFQGAELIRGTDRPISGTHPSLGGRLRPSGTGLRSSGAQHSLVRGGLSVASSTISWAHTSGDFMRFGYPNRWEIRRAR